MDKEDIKVAIELNPMPSVLSDNLSVHCIRGQLLYFNENLTTNIQNQVASSFEDSRCDAYDFSPTCRWTLIQICYEGN